MRANRDGEPGPRHALPIHALNHESVVATRGTTCVRPIQAARASAKAIKTGRFDAIIASDSRWAAEALSSCARMSTTRTCRSFVSSSSCRRREFGAPLVPPRGCTGSDGRTSLTLPLANAPKFAADLETFWRRKKGPQLTAEIPGGTWRGVRDSNPWPPA